MSCELFPVVAILLVAGLTALFRPEWHAAIERRRRASGTTLRPREIEFGDGWYDFTRAVGLVFTAVGAVLLAGCLV